MNEPLDIRKFPGAEVLEHINCAYVARRFFNRTRAWFIQRLNNNAVNGKPVSFTEAELLTLRSALLTLSKEIRYYSTNIPNTESMDIKVYVIAENSDPRGGVVQIILIQQIRGEQPGGINLAAYVYPSVTVICLEAEKIFQHIRSSVSILSREVSHKTPTANFEIP